MRDSVWERYNCEISEVKLASSCGHDISIASLDV